MTALLGVTALATCDADRHSGRHLHRQQPQRRDRHRRGSCRSRCVSVPPLVTSFVLLLFAARTGWLPVGGSIARGASIMASVDVFAHSCAGARVANRGHARATAVAGDAGSSGRTLDAGGARARLLAHARDLASRAASVAQAGPGRLRGDIGTVLSGSFAVEIVTSWPGLGALMYEALVSRDLYLVAGCAAAGRSFLAPVSSCPMWRWRLPTLAWRRGRDSRRSPRCHASARRYRTSSCRWLSHWPVPDGQTRHRNSSGNSSMRRRCCRTSSMTTAICASPFVYPLRLTTASTIPTAKTAPIRCRCGSSPRRLRLRRPGSGAPWFPLAPTHSDATNSRAWPWRQALARGRAVGRTWRAAIGALAWRLAGFFGGVLDDGSDAACGCDCRAACALCRAGASRLDATRPDRAAGVLDDGSRVGAGWMAMAGTGCARGRRGRARAGVRRICARAGCRRTRFLLRHLLPAARGFLVVQATLLVPGVHPCRSDAFLRRTRASASRSRAGVRCYERLAMAAPSSKLRGSLRLRSVSCSPRLP